MSFPFFPFRSIVVGQCDKKTAKNIMLAFLNKLCNKYLHKLHEKMALYCPKGSGTLRQQLLMMHGDAWYCIVLHGIALYCMVLHGIAWYYMVLHGIAWYCIVLHCIA